MPHTSCSENSYCGSTRESFPDQCYAHSVVVVLCSTLVWCRVRWRVSDCGCVGVHVARRSVGGQCRLGENQGGFNLGKAWAEGGQSAAGRQPAGGGGLGRAAWRAWARAASRAGTATRSGRWRVVRAACSVARGACVIGQEERQHRPRHARAGLRALPREERRTDRANPERGKPASRSVRLRGGPRNVVRLGVGLCRLGRSRGKPK
jgi:hypothetical protein